MKKLILSATVLSALFASATPALAAKACEELKTEIAAKLDEKKVTGYKLDIVDTDKVGDAKVVGSCDGGKKKIVYSKS